MKLFFAFALVVLLTTFVSATSINIGNGNSDSPSVKITTPTPPTNYSLFPTVNSSDYWDNMDTINTTQMEDNGGILNILESWLSSFISGSINDTQKTTSGIYLYNNSNTIYFNETQLNNTIDDRASNNASFNESYTDDKYVNEAGDTMTEDLIMNNSNINISGNLTISDPVNISTVGWARHWYNSTAYFISTGYGKLVSLTDVLIYDTLQAVKNITTEQYCNATNCYFVQDFLNDSDTFVNWTHLSNFTDDILWTTSFNSTGDGRWFNKTSLNTTQTESNGGILNILESWVDSLWCRLTGCTMTGDLSMGDNIKHFFGDDNDSSIYHNGTDMIINPKESGTGKLKIAGLVHVYDDSDTITEWLIENTHPVAGGGNARLNLKTTAVQWGIWVTSQEQFQIRDVTYSQSPLRIEHGASGDQLVIDSNGVHVDTTATKGKLTVRGDIGLYIDNDKYYTGNGKDVSYTFNATDGVCAAEVGTPNYYFTGFNKVNLGKVMQLNANTSAVTCSVGTIYYDGTLNKHMACNGTWNEMY